MLNELSPLPRKAVPSLASIMSLTSHAPYALPFELCVLLALHMINLPFSFIVYLLIISSLESRISTAEAEPMSVQFTVVSTTLCLYRRISEWVERAF